MTPEQAVTVLNAVEKQHSDYPYRWDDHYHAWVVGKPGREWTDEREWFTNEQIIEKANKALTLLSQREDVMERVRHQQELCKRNVEVCAAKYGWECPDYWPADNVEMLKLWIESGMTLEHMGVE